MCAHRQQKTRPVDGSSNLTTRQLLASKCRLADTSSVRRLVGLGLSLIALAACSGIEKTTPSITDASHTTSLGSAASGTTLSKEPVIIAIIGDFGDGGDAQYEVGRAISAHDDLDYLLTTGDNFYTDDVDAIWSKPYGWLEDRPVKVYAAWGNHDIETKSRERLVRKYLNLHRNWYTADLGPLLLVVLDSNQHDHPGQKQWLATRLKNAGKPVVVTFHHALFSCGAHGSNRMVQEAWLDLFREYEVVVVFNGHEHDYERFLDGRTHYIVTGGAGRPLRPFADCASGTPKPIAGNATHHHYVLLEASDSRLRISAMTADGRVIDELEIELND